MNKRSLSLLLVEDNEVQAELVKDLLGGSREPAFAVTHCVRLAEAVAAISEEVPDVVLLDLTLPDSTGTAGIERMQRCVPDTPIVVLTNAEDERLAARCVRHGAQDYLLKREVDVRSLRRAVRYAMERMHAERVLRDSEQRYALAVDGANDGVWDWDMRTGKAYFSPRWKAIVGVQDEDAGTDIAEWLDRVDEEDRGAFRDALNAHLAGRTRHFEHEHRLRTSHGNSLWVLSRGVAVRDAQGKPYRMAGSLSDISARKRAEAQLIHDALHDALTKLPNRALLMDRLDVALKSYARHGEHQFAVLYLDLDRFKNINDSLGHVVGDELLIQVARRIERFLRPGDTLARLGGDEFTVLINDVSESHHATYVAERIHELLSEVFIIHDHEVFTSASIGIALSAAHYRRPEEVLRDADLAMYRAKAGGHAHYEVFDSAMHESALALHRLETDLRRGVERQEFEIHYQPIVTLDSGRILGFEALLRWRHPNWGMMGPDSFINVAEETGLIVPLGWWVLRESCRQARRWQEMFPVTPPLSISVNVSGKLIAQPDMAEGLAAILEQSALDAASLRLEITERAMMSHGADCLSALQSLRDMGVQLHVDDFGTGYSSLSYLQRFAYDTLKIDRSFVSSIGVEREESAIVGAIIALGESLGIKVIAEGVETLKQLETLRDMRCPQAQGFWFSKPLDRTAMGALLDETIGHVH